MGWKGGLVVAANAEERGEAGEAIFGEAMEAISDEGSEGWRGGALGIGEAAADGKFDALGGFDAERAEFSCEFSFAWEMSDDRGLGIVVGFDLEKGGGASGIVGGLGLAEHQAFAAEVDDAVAFGDQVGAAFAGVLDDQFDVRIFGGDGGLEEFEAFFERAFGGRGIEDHEADFFPTIVRVVGADYAESGFELASSQPELAIEGDILGELGEEIVWGDDGVAVPGEEFLAIPEAALAVVFFANPPSCGVDGGVPDIGEKECWRRDCGGGLGWRWGKFGEGD